MGPRSSPQELRPPITFKLSFNGLSFLRITCFAAFCFNFRFKDSAAQFLLKRLKLLYPASKVWRALSQYNQISIKIIIKTLKLLNFRKIHIFGTSSASLRTCSSRRGFARLISSEGLLQKWE